MFRQLSIVILVLAVCAPLSVAQTRGGMGRPASGAHARFARGVPGAKGFYRGRWPLSVAGFLGYPFLYSDYDSTDAYPAGNLENSFDNAAPRVVVVQPASTGSAPRQARVAPLLIEWQGDRYVRFGGAQVKDEHGTDAHPDYAEAAAARALPTTVKPEAALTKELPPTVLVYRDGHREEISGYAIAEGVIYVRGSDWQNGAWTKHIPLSALDPVATMQANQERGAKFMLPSAPNVVIASF
jgi:hypothetical protein